MSITFGFITDGKNDDLLMQGINSAINSGVDNYEVIVIGNSKIQSPLVRIINFNESEKIGWITRKKNLIAKESTKEILVILHDYLELGELWNETNIQMLLRSSWDVAVCRIENLDGTRFRDWLIWPFSNRLLKLPFTYTLKCLLPYNFNKVPNLMYINGSVLIVRRQYLLENPLDESRSWGQGEDVEWSLRLRNNWSVSFFTELNIKCLKQKDVAFSQIDSVTLFFIRIYACILKKSSSFNKWAQIPY